MIKLGIMVLLTELQTDLESFLVRERIKIQDECSQRAVSKVISTCSGKKDRVQQMIDSWSNAFLQVSNCLCAFSSVQQLA